MNTFLLPVSLRIFVHLLMGALALWIYGWLKPGWPEGANIWAMIAGIAFLLDVMRWAGQMVTAFGQLDPVEKALRHAGQGIALIVLTVMSAHWVLGSYSAIWAYLTARSWVNTAIIALPVLIGLARFAAGIVDVWWYPTRFMPLMLASLKVTAALYLYRWGMQEFGLRTDQAGQYSLALIILPAVWFAVTGTVRFVIVSGIISLIPTIIIARREAAMRRRLKRELVHGSSGIVDGNDLIGRLGE